MSHVALSGGTSFTALWITHELINQGHTVSVLCQNSLKDYSGIKKKRLAQLPLEARQFGSIHAEKGELAAWIQTHRPDFFIFHHHHMTDFRSPTYDYDKAMEVSSRPLGDLVKALKDAGTRGVIYSGTYFEPGEGGQRDNSQVTPYAKSKKIVWEKLQSLCSEAEISLSKIVIPNPIGPLENEDRLIPTLIKNAHLGLEFVSRSPQSVGDHLPARALAEVYGEAIGLLEKNQARIFRPSGKISTVREFIELTQSELIRERLHLKPCSVKFSQDDKSPVTYQNPRSESRSIDWAKFWDFYASVIRD